MHVRKKENAQVHVHVFVFLRVCICAVCATYNVINTRKCIRGAHSLASKETAYSSEDGPTGLQQFLRPLSTVFENLDALQTGMPKNLKRETTWLQNMHGLQLLQQRPSVLTYLNTRTIAVRFCHLVQRRPSRQDINISIAYISCARACASEPGAGRRHTLHTMIPRTRVHARARRRADNHTNRDTMRMLACMTNTRCGTFENAWHKLQHFPSACNLQLAMNRILPVKQSEWHFRHAFFSNPFTYG
jgi:hypothetical protein